MGLLVPGGFAWLFVGLLGHGFMGLFVANDCSWCCGGFAWLMVVRGGFFWCRGWVFLVSWLGFLIGADGFVGLMGLDW